MHQKERKQERILCHQEMVPDVVVAGVLDKARVAVEVWGVVVKVLALAANASALNAVQLLHIS